MSGAEITTDIPARVDRLPWSNFHLLVVIALGVTWILDGLEVTIVGSIGPILKDKQTLGLTDQGIGDIATCYVGGAVVGAAVGAAASLLLLSGHYVGIDIGWRLGFGIGAVLSGFILFLRRYVPESPRWQITHGREQEAKQNTDEIERKVGKRLPSTDKTLKIHPRKVFGFGLILGAMLGKNRGRSFLALSLMVAQAFLFNAVFFTYGLVLTKFYHIEEVRIGIYILPLAAGNFLGPLLL
ncbi:MAG: sugar porter family MFS transporter, partial [Pseudomonadota bacterium]|nr:sugar porter family MFS transporter [Pseudomonadota bacterium]